MMGAPYRDIWLSTVQSKGRVKLGYTSLLYTPHTHTQLQPPTTVSAGKLYTHKMRETGRKREKNKNARRHGVIRAGTLHPHARWARRGGVRIAGQGTRDRLEVKHHLQHVVNAHASGVSQTRHDGGHCTAAQIHGLARRKQTHTHR